MLKRKRGERKEGTRGEVGHSKELEPKRKRRRTERREGGVLERKGLRREGSRLGELDFLKRSRLILHSKEFYFNPSSLRAKLGALKCLQQVNSFPFRFLGLSFSFKACFFYFIVGL